MGAGGGLSVQLLGCCYSHCVQVSLLAPCLLVTLVRAQDSYHCPDGWDYSGLGDTPECLLLVSNERVTKADALILCEFHGGWLVDMDEGHGSAKNNLLKSLISKHESASP